MGAKRALIVDDSKSARLFLARILEKYEIDVDSADTAESAIEYLATHRPDVIFMDHLMPGMDGFQAVQAIKNNPLTATIPIMMYTSQEGELYLGQARALGAVGVLPKQIKPTDVSKVLYQLHLLQERRSSYQTSFRALNVPPEAAVAEQSAANESGMIPKVLTETSLREQFAELRRALVAGVDTQTDRITSEVRALLLEALPPAAPTAIPTLPPEPLHKVQDAGWLVAGLAVLIALGTLVLWRQEANQLRALTAEMSQLRRDVASQLAAAGAPRAPVAASGQSVATAPGPTPETAGPGIAEPARIATSSTAVKAIPTDAKPLILTVPYGGEALGGPRLEMIRQLLDRLAKENHRGLVDIKTFAGRFCLMGNATDGYSLPPDETLFSKCDVVGNPAEDGLLVAQRIPLPFANLVGTVHNSSHGNLDVQASAGDVGVSVAPYPPVAADLTAGEWNRAASVNNRIEIRVR